MARVTELGICAPLKKEILWVQIPFRAPIFLPACVGVCA